MNTNLNSLSHMSPTQIEQFKIENHWEQNRTLAKPIPDKTKPWYEKIHKLMTGSSYEELLGGLFVKSMQEHKENDIYVDVGAGDGTALFEYLDFFPNGAKVIGIASTQPHNISKVIENDKNNSKFSFYLCDFNEFPTESLKGRVSLISDVKGAFRYSLYPHKVIDQMGKLLKTGGLVFIQTGYGIGIKPDMIPEKQNMLNSRQETQGSNQLLHLWFQTIKGFDVIQHEKTFENVESSIAINKEIIDNPDKWDNQMRDNQLIILRRNSDPVEVDPLVYDSEFVENWQKNSGEKHWDEWAPKYKWEMSEKSKELTKKIHKFVNQ